MRAGRVEEANALAQHIGKDIARRCVVRLSKLDSKVDSKGMWAAVRQFTGQRRDGRVADGVTAVSLNHHYTSYFDR